MKTLENVLRWTAVGILGTVTLLLATWLLIALLGIGIDLSFALPQFEAAAKQALGRTVTAERSILYPTLWPTVELRDVRVANPPAWPDSSLLEVDRLRTTIGLLALVRGEIRIGELSAQGIRIQLSRNGSGEASWILPSPTAAPEHWDSKAQQAAFVAPLPAIELRELSLQDLSLVWREQQTGRSFDLELAQISGTASTGEPLRIVASGALRQQPLTLSLETEPLQHLLAMDRAWPLTLDATLGGSTLALVGMLDPTPERRGFELDARLRGASLGELAAAADLSLKEFGDYHVAARITGRENRLRITSLDAKLGELRLSGALELDLAGPRPRLQGALDAARLDTRMLQAMRAARQTDSPQRGQASNEGAFTLSAETRRALDLDLELRIGEAIVEPLRLIAPRLHLRLEDGDLSAPFSTTIEGIPLDGRLDLSGETETVSLVLTLATTEADVAALGLLLTGDESFAGRVGNLDAELSWEGDDLAALVGEVRLELSLTDSAVSYSGADGDPVGMHIDRLDTSLEPGRATRVSATGTLLDTPFTLGLEGGGLEQLLQGLPWPIAATFSGAGAELRLEGELRQRTADAGPHLNLNLAGEQLGRMSSWTGVDPTARLPYSLTGTLLVTDTGWRLDELQARLGQTRVSGSLAETGTAGEELFGARLRFPVLHVKELEQAVAREPGKDGPATPGLTIDVPLLPSLIEIRDADLDLGIRRLILVRTEVSDLSMSAQIRDGYVAHAPFQASIGEARFTGDALLDLRGQDPMANLNLATDQVDIGRLLEHLAIIEDLNARAGRLQADLRLRGNSLRELLDNSAIEFTIDDGLWTFFDPNLQAQSQVEITRGVAGARAGQPLRIDLAGSLDGMPVTIGVQTAPLHQIVLGSGRLPMQIAAEAAGARLELNAGVTFPLGQRDMDFQLSLSGGRLDELDDLLLLSLPPWGPYAIGGRFQILPDGYHLSDLDLQIGSSSLEGRADLFTTGGQPSFDIELLSRSVQLDDFETGDWSLTRASGPSAPADANSVSATQGGTLAPGLRTVLSRELMRGIDARLRVSVEEVVSGDDHLGRGRVEAELRGGRLELRPVFLEVPGGEVNLSLALDRSREDIRTELRADVDRLDYGILARRVDPETPMAGLLSLDVELESGGDEFADLKRNASGYIDLALWPENLRGDVFDIWAVNLLFAILPTLVPGTESKVNCLIGRFDVADGLMTDKSLLLDTTTVRVRGSGTVNFKTDEIDLLLEPYPKRPQFFSLSTPLVVDGHVSDFRVSVTPADLIGTVLRFAYSYVVVPFQWLTEGALPADGSDVCGPVLGGAANNETPPDPQPAPPAQPADGHPGGLYE